MTCGLMTIEQKIRRDCQVRRDLLWAAYRRAYGGDRGRWTKDIEAAYLADMRAINQAERQQIREVWK